MDAVLGDVYTSTNGGMAMNMNEIQKKILASCEAQEYGDVRSMLDEWMPIATHGMVVKTIRFLLVNCKGAYFSYDKVEGWSYDEPNDTNDYGDGDG